MLEPGPLAVKSVLNLPTGLPGNSQKNQSFRRQSLSIEVLQSFETSKSEVYLICLEFGLHGRDGGKSFRFQAQREVLVKEW